MHHAVFTGTIFFGENGHKTALDFVDLADGISISMSSSGGTKNQVGFLIHGIGIQPHEASQNAELKLKKFHNFLKVTLDYPIEINVTSRTHAESFDKFFNFHTNLESLINSISKESFNNYLNNSTDDKEELLIEGIEDNHDRNIVSAFSKLANFLEGTETGKKFKPIRDALSHEIVDTAQEKVEKQFPNEFEFDGKRFKRSSEKNKSSLRKYWPELLDASKTKFFELVGD